MPPPSPSLLQPQRRPNPENKPAAAAAIPHTRRTEAQPKHERPDIRPANILYSCIDRASCGNAGRTFAESRLVEDVSGETDAALASVYGRRLPPIREVVSGSLPVSRNDTAATLKRIIVVAPISPMKTRWRSTSTPTFGFFPRSVIVVLDYIRASSTWGSGSLRNSQIYSFQWMLYNH